MSYFIVATQKYWYCTWTHIHVYLFSFAGLDARFDKITAFAQVDNTTVIIADSGNCCLKKLDRVTGIVSDFSGDCMGEKGYDNSKFKTLKYEKLLYIGVVWTLDAQLLPILQLQ